MQGMKKERRIEIGRRIKELRHKNDLSQEQMAEVLDISVSHYGKIERGDHSLSIDQAVRLFDRFEKIDLNYLFTGKRTYPNILNTLLEICPPEKKNQIKKLFQEFIELTRY